ncbi:unnamed protein product [Adineta steineri]|uniref:Glycosyl hydrolase family 13 catalytic domain-containing protein n=2 Tax=Adineta steineri TaxID=433720 RepID=A0A813P3D5_9BILA|nr:unnamed protein product [Adineta steineri]CAF1506515.1 unnamed protein product [Adineta steineri]
MKFSLFAPTIDDVKLILDDKEIDMDKQSDGRFICTVDNIFNGDHKYKFRIKKKNGFEKCALFRSENGKEYHEEFHWKYDQIKLPENKQLVLYEMFVQDFADNGQFSGVINKLDYLVELGINAIELTPIMGIEEAENDTWGYLPSHFFSIRSSYGTKNDLKLLVDECHSRKIRYYKGKHHPDDPYNWGPELNYDFQDQQLKVEPAVKFISDVVKYWFEEFHLDGIRFDAAKQMDNFEILGRLDRLARSIRSDQLFLSQAEYVPENKDICKENGGPVDVCWSASFHHWLTGFLTLNKDQMTKHGTLSDLKYSFSSKNLVNYLSCHDNERLLHDIGKKDSDAFIRMETAVIHLFTSVGIPMIWQGEELGEDRQIDVLKDKKKHYPMPWNFLQKDFNRRLFNLFQNLIKLRRSNKDLQEGPINFFFEDENNRILAYSRGLNLIIITNFDQKPKLKYIISNLPQQGKWIDYLTNEQVDVDQVNNLTLTLLPFQSRLFIKHI